jgi:hypothetical protein
VPVCTPVCLPSLKFSDKDILRSDETYDFFILLTYSNGFF